MITHQIRNKNFLIIEKMSENLGEKFTKLQIAVSKAKPDVESVLQKSNKSAARRARKELMSISKLCKELRADITEHIK